MSGHSLTIALPPSALSALRGHSALYGCPPERLAAKLLEIILRDGLVEAVGPSATKRAGPMIDAATLLEMEAAFRHLSNLCGRLDEGPAGEACRAAARKLEAARMQMEAEAKADPEAEHSLTTAEAAERFGLTRDYVEKLCKRHRGVGVRIGARWKVSPSGIKAALGR